MDSNNRVLDEDLLDHHGRLLLAKGNHISEQLNYLLKKRNLIDKAVFRGNASGAEAASKAEANGTIVHTVGNSNYDTTKNLIASQTVNICRRTPLINIEMVARASCLVSDLIYLSRSSSWGLPVNTLINHAAWIYSHSVNVAILACAFGYWLKIDDESIKDIGIGALLHDVGKLLVPVEIVNKQGELSEEEWLLIKAHPQLGYSMLKPYSLSEDILNITLQHHERFDGSGYPQGLKGCQISLPVQIAAISSMFDAVTSERPYHPARSIKETLAIMEKKRDISFKSSLLDEFKKLLGIC